MIKQDTSSESWRIGTAKMPGPPAGFYLINFGCKLNQSEGEELAARFAAAGYIRVSVPSDASIIIINGCTVTARADGKVRRTLGSLRKKTGAYLIVCGCYGDRYPDSPADAVFSNAGKVLPERMNISEDNETATDSFKTGGEVSNPVKPFQTGHGKAEAVSDYKPDVSGNHQPGSPKEQDILPQHERTRAFLKIQDGCTATCTYCVVRLVRKYLWAVSSYELEKRLGQIQEQGFREIVLLGANLSLLSMAEHHAGIDLMEILSMAAGYFPRVRLGSLEPHAVIDVVRHMAKTPRLCRHLHIPLQSGSGRILRLMDRKYDPEQFLDIVREARRILPELEITTDIIAGFPGETEKDLEDSLSMIESCGFSKVHAFPFSPRPGTAAAEMAGHDPAVARARTAVIMESASTVAQIRRNRLAGTTQEVLFETIEDGAWEGYTGGYIRFRLDAEIANRPDFRNNSAREDTCGSENNPEVVNMSGEVRRVRVSHTGDDALYGTLCDEARS